MRKVLATELRRKPSALSVLPRKYRTDSNNFSRRNSANSHAAAGPIIGSHAGHQFSSVAIVGDELTSMLPNPFLQAVRSTLYSNSRLGASPAALYEENLDGQPSPEAGVVDDASGAVPLDTADVAVPMSDTVTGGTQTGATRCDTATGKVITATLNTNECTKDCSTKHEDKHAADIAPCCTKAGAASKAATTESDKTDIQTKFDNWMLSNRPFLECRAYAVSVSCGDAKHKKANCEKESYGKCCKALVWYIRTARIEGEAACNHADKNLSDCPFS